MKRSSKFITLFIVLTLGVTALFVYPGALEVLAPEEEASMLESVTDRTQYQLDRIIDGDTIVLNIRGKSERVRLIGIDTPESDECYANEATSYLRLLLDDGPVYIETDSSQGMRDQHNRRLAFIYTTDGTFVNKEMLNDGYASVMRMSVPHRYVEEFNQAQKRAQENRRGMWARGVCDRS